MRRSHVESRSYRTVTVQNDRNCREVGVESQSVVAKLKRRNMKPVNAMHDKLALLRERMGV